MLRPPDRVTLMPQALGEVREAYVWYSSVDPRLAASFELALQQALEALAEAPLRWAERAPGVRCFLMPRLSYKLYYAVRGPRIDVLAVVHHARRPATGRP